MIEISKSIINLPNNSEKLNIITDNYNSLYPWFMYIVYGLLEVSENGKKS